MLNKINLNNYEQLIDEVENPKGNIVFIHGFGGTARSKMSFRKNYKDYNFYSITLPGHGISKIKSKEEIDFLFYIKVVEAFINSLSLKKIILLGHSMGGGIALNIATILKDKISHLILEAPANPSVVSNYEIVSKLIPHSVEETLQLYQNLFYDLSSMFPNEESMMKFITKEYEISKQGNDLSRLLIKENIEKWMNVTNKAIQENKIKTLLILGEYDKIVITSETQKIFQKYKIYQIEILSKTGHMPLFEKSQECYKLIDKFISQ